MIFLNLFLGTFVVAVGFWLLWGGIWTIVLVIWTLIVGGFLWWTARTITEVWAWSTLLLGLESVAWPLMLMSRLNFATATPPEEEMATALSAVVLGLFSSVFWISFSYGLFKRARGTVTSAPKVVPPTHRPGKSRQTR